MLYIRRYEIPLGVTDFEIDAPRGANVLVAQVQNGKPYVWLLQSLDQETIRYCFKVYDDNEEIDHDYYFCGEKKTSSSCVILAGHDVKYVDTFVMPNTERTYHVFYIGVRTV